MAGADGKRLVMALAGLLLLLAGVGLTLWAAARPKPEVVIRWRGEPVFTKPDGSAGGARKLEP